MNSHLEYLSSIMVN